MMYHLTTALFLLSAKIGMEATFLVGVHTVQDVKINLMTSDMDKNDLNVYMEDFAEFKSVNFTAPLSSAICRDQGIYLVAINDFSKPRVAVIDLQHRKVLGLVENNAFIIDNVECDSNGNGYLFGFIAGHKHFIHKVDTAKMVSVDWMFSSRRSASGSCFDRAESRMFIVNKFYNDQDILTYSVDQFLLTEKKEILSKGFANYSIGSMVFDEQKKLPLAYVQTPLSDDEGTIYTQMLAYLMIEEGRVVPVGLSWSGKAAAIAQSQLTMDQLKRVIFILTPDRYVAFDLEALKIISERDQYLPGPVTSYEFVRTLE